MKHELSNLKMPKGGPKITDEIIKDFESWISAGAFDPRIRPPTAEQFAQETSWEKIREKRKEWWSFQPVKNEVPSGDSDHPVDKFLRDKMILRASFLINQQIHTLFYVDLLLPNQLPHPLNNKIGLETYQKRIRPNCL